MLSFQLSTLNSAEATPDVLAAWELAAFFLVEASPDDLPMDEDQAREWYIGNIVEDDSRDDYRAEPQMADAEMAESFSKSLRDLALERIKAMGDNYPFILDDRGALIRRDDRPLGAIGASYMSLQFFRGLIGKTIEIDGESDEEVKERKKAFDKNFRKVFEYIAGYAVAGNTYGSPFMTSHCRSAKRLEGILKTACRKIGAGDVHPFNNWDPEQKNANDGGVDCLVYSGGPGVPGNSVIFLVGATVQETAIKNKIMGRDELEFVGKFFSTQPAAFSGILVRPQDEDALTISKCVKRNCLLYSYDQIWQGMGKGPAGHEQRKMFVRLDAKARKLLREFLEITLVFEFESFALEAA